jgi:large subunit ribosomal protein L22
MAVQAYAKNVSSSPRKLNLVAALVRGRNVSDALVILEHTPKKAAAQLADVIKSAKANATNNQKMAEDGLELASVEVTAGRVLKRWRPEARGRVSRYSKRSANVRIVVDQVAGATPAAVKAKPTKSAAAKVSK